MTSHDVRDMLDLPGTAGPRPAKKQKIAAPKSTLKGLAREVQSLGGDNPIAIVPEISVFKKRRLASRKPAARWEHRPFKNSARSDDLILKHWRRKPEVPPAPPGEEGKEQEEKKDEMDVDEPIDDSIFAKFNVQVQVPKYDDEQYNAHLQNEHWTRDETDYLMGLAQEYDLRWPVIWDRYEYVAPTPEEESEEAIIPAPRERSQEELKARYYKVAAAMMIVHKPQDRMISSEFALYETMLAFNPAQEAARKRFAENAFQRTREEAKEEESLLLELKRILARSEKLNEERRELYARLDAPPTTGNVNQLINTSAGLQSLLHQLMSADKSKKRRSLVGPDGASPASAGPNSLQQGLDRRDSSLRDSVSGPSGSNNKKGAQGPAERRQLTEDEERTYGVSHPTDRITSGPFFRYEKLSKPITLKSTAQQAKITNTFNELGLPARLIMPTVETGAAYEVLLESVVKMLQFRAVSEKLSGEIAVARAQKAEREKRERAARGEPEPEPEPEAEPGPEAAEKEKGKETGNEQDAAENAEGDGSAPAEGDATADAAEPQGDVPAPAAADADADVKMEEEREKSAAPSTRGGSVHKRSASVLSTVSDKSTKSTKRQKK
jgi:DNA methyltransferase 1-associated protein 1